MLNSLLDFYTFFEDQFYIRLENKENKLCVLDGIKVKLSKEFGIRLEF